MSRLPIRIRLTLAFAAVVAAVLGGTGLFLYLRLESNLDQAIDRGLQARLADVAVLSQQKGKGLSNARPGSSAEPDANFAQLLRSSDGVVLSTTPGVSGSPLVGRNELARSRHGSYFLDRHSGEADRVRLLVAPLSANGKEVVGVVGTSLSDRDTALATLRSELVVGGPLTLILVLVSGYALAAGALRPVERMRKAAATFAGKRGQRLPLPKARDELARLGETLNAMLAEREEALAQAEHALAHERSFVSDASHELRTPLALLKGELEVALREPRSPGELEAAVVSAAEEADRLSQLAEDLLLLARLDEGMLPLRLGPVDVGDLFDAISSRFASRVAETGRRIETKVNGQSHLAADRLRLEQALANLVENSLRHGEGTVELLALEHDGRMELHVRDEGPGFPPSFLARAFERFSRANAARTGGGTGLGLAIVATIAEAHGGSARAANREQGGADVWISLPQSAP